MSPSKVAVGIMASVFFVAFLRNGTASKIVKDLEGAANAGLSGTTKIARKI